MLLAAIPEKPLIKSFQLHVFGVIIDSYPNVQVIRVEKCQENCMHYITANGG